MLDDLAALKEPRISEAINQMEVLLSRSKRAFLLGAGCSCCAGLPLLGDLTNKVLSDSELKAETREILEATRQSFSADTSTIEDYLSELVDLLSITERRTQRHAKQASVNHGSSRYGVGQLREALQEIKKSIARAIAVVDSDLSWHRKFVGAVHGALQSGKMGSARQPVDYFILNYDTLLEDALALEKLDFVDGFSGGATGWWNSRKFETEGLDARVVKLHGSIDWNLVGVDPLPRRFRGTITPIDLHEQVLIWPATTKYREAQRDPYAQLMDIFRKELCPPSRSEIVLAVCGYAFGDSHINLEIERGLFESEGRMTMVAFSSSQVPEGKLLEWLSMPAVREQVTVYARRGFFHGAIEHISDVDLPWWKFENITRLLRGER